VYAIAVDASGVYVGGSFEGPRANLIGFEPLDPFIQPPAPPGDETPPSVTTTPGTTPPLTAIKRKPRLACEKRSKRRARRCTISTVRTPGASAFRLRLLEGKNVLVSGKPSVENGRYVLRFSMRRTLPKGGYTIQTIERDRSLRTVSSSDALTLRRSL
jgi:hypothetical protein